MDSLYTAIANIGFPAAIAAFLIYGVAKTNEKIVTRLLNGYGAKFDRLSDRIESLDVSIRVLCEVVKHGRPFGEGAPQGGVKGEAAGKGEGDQRVQSHTA
ncbi:MAG: hypothetical protein NZ902_06500 [Acidilobaceae archaeon]|nr:hypothetical protein [Acidilobaceae archaeon]